VRSTSDFYTFGDLGAKGFLASLGFGATGTFGDLDCLGATGTRGDLDFLGATGTLGDLDCLGAVGFLATTGMFGDLDFVGTTGLTGDMGFFVLSFFNVRAGSSGTPLVRLELFLSPIASPARHRVGKTIPKKTLIAA
jgi:hypothetical protein